MKILEVENLGFTYEGMQAPTLSGVDFTAHAGELIYICGPTGAGKSTLLHCLKREIRPPGKLTGSIRFKGAPLDAYTAEQLLRAIGIVFQDPDNQTVMDTVIGEMAFGLENLGIEPQEIRRRISEIAGYFGVDPLLHKAYRHLSGGERQTVNLCAILAMRPQVLLLDEPASQLDPVARTEFTGMLRRINEDFGMTILVSEHGNEEMQACADRMLVLDSGRIRYSGHPRAVAAEALRLRDTKAVALLPTAVRLFEGVSPMTEIPMTIKEAQRLVGREKLFERKWNGGDKTQCLIGDVAIDADDLLFTYRSESERQIIKNLCLTVRKGEFVGIVGGNGSGKSTLLKLLCGLALPLDGRIDVGGTGLHRMDRRQICERIFYVPQNPLTYFTFDTVGEELRDAAAKAGKDEAAAVAAAEGLGLAAHLLRHPYDLSGGERQKVLIACAVLRDAGILLLDEATKGLDPLSRKELGCLLSDMARSGKSIVMVSHDLEFLAAHADKCAMLFDGSLGGLQDTRDFFRDNYFYTTVAKRIFRDILPDVLTIEEVTAVGNA